MTQYTQTERPLKIQTTLGDDALLLARIDGEEGISRLFHFDLDLVSPKLDVDAADLLRTAAAVTFPLHDGNIRTIHGIFNRFSQTGRDGDLATYHAEIVAWPWFLSLRRDSRIFQNKSILDIAEKIFGSWGFTDFDFRCESRPAREFIVQYAETDWAFISRWLEAEGIFYFFDHADEGHTLVLADANTAMEPCPNISEAWIRGRAIVDMDTVGAVTFEHSVQVGKVTLKDFDYLQPSLSLEASEGDGVGEIYDYPGWYATPEDASRYARYRLEAEEARREEIRGEGNCRWMQTGHTFELQGHFNADTNGEYVLTSIRHACGTAGFRTGESESFDYRNTFMCMPAGIPFRPPLSTPAPQVRGSQTAIVVGPEGEEVWTDKYGRVKIQFHWDREGRRNEDSSCWVRVATPWGGKGYGSVSVPRIGNEVLVDFLEGNPDRPIIVASVYNAEQMPPFELPGSGIQMGMKSRSSPGGGGYNEITATDTKGKEQMTVNAQYDMSTAVGNDETHTVGNNRTASVAVDETCDVGSNQVLSVGADQDLSVGGNRSVSVGGNEDVNVGGNQGTSVAGDRSVDVGGSDAISSGSDMSHAAGANLKLDAAANLEASAGANGKLSAGANIDVEAGASIKLSAGGSTIEIGPGGIKITSGGMIELKGAMIKQNS
jgi:type VI secretion system secreted protein VgrG